MPTHRIPRDRYDEDILELGRKQGERVVSKVLDGDVFIVETEYITLETRLGDPTEASPFGAMADFTHRVYP